MSFAGPILRQKEGSISMNTERKPQKTLNGDLLLPLSVGARAVILHQGRITRTSRVVAIHGRSEGEVCFETLNTQYRLLTGPSSEPAADCFPLTMAA